METSRDAASTAREEEICKAADASRAARKTANEKLLDFIINMHGAEEHLMNVITEQVESRWLDNFRDPKGHRVMMYIEDDEQIDSLYSYLDGVLGAVTVCSSLDKIKLILDVLMPEAIILAMSTLESVPMKEAEKKFINGPVYTQSEGEEFDYFIMRTSATNLK